MNLIDETQGKLDEAFALAKMQNDNSLIECIKRLEQTDVNCKTKTTIYTDFAPYSFYFVRADGEVFRGNGGVIFHGKHDNGGDGSAPTYSVSINPTNGWSIHT